MTWKVSAKRLTTSSNTNLEVFQEVIPGRSRVLKGIQVFFIAFNDPSLVDIEMRVYSKGADGLPRKLLTTSIDTVSKERILPNPITNPYSLLQTYFNFDFYPLRESESYLFVPFINGYTGDDLSHIAWRQDYPDPRYKTGLTINTALKIKAPKIVPLITGEL